MVTFKGTSYFTKQSSKASLLEMALSAKERARRWKERQKKDPEKHQKYLQAEEERYELRKKAENWKMYHRWLKEKKEQCVKDGEQIKNTKEKGTKIL